MLQRVVLEKVLPEAGKKEPMCKYVHLMSEVNDAVAAKQCPGAHARAYWDGSAGAAACGCAEGYKEVPTGGCEVDRAMRLAQTDCSAFAAPFSMGRFSYRWDTSPSASRRTWASGSHSSSDSSSANSSWGRCGTSWD